MKKAIYKLLCSALIVSFLFSAFAFAASAEKSGELTTAGDAVIPAPEISKSEFAAQCREKAKRSGIKQSLSDEEISELKQLYLSGSDPEYYEKLLNDAGVYIYSSTVGTSNTRSQAGDVVLTNAMIVYTEILDMWSITCNGEWKNLSAISDEIPFILFPTVGKKKTIGGHDVIAMEFIDTSGIAPNMTDSFIRVSPSIGDHTDVIRGPYDYDSTGGVVYTFEDYIEITSVNLSGYRWLYYGAFFSIEVRFDSSFENFHGKARGAYGHTWSTSQLTSINFGINGITLGWSNMDKVFYIRSQPAIEF